MDPLYKSSFYERSIIFVNIYVARTFISSFYLIEEMVICINTTQHTSQEISARIQLLVQLMKHSFYQ